MDIETKRLKLVPVSEKHIEDIFEHFNKRITTYMFPAPAKDISETREVVSRFIEQREMRTDYVYAITLKPCGEFIGLCGLHSLKNETPEIGVWTKIEAHGNHYGREAVGGLIQYAGSLGIKKLYYPVDRRNVPSKKIPLYYGGIPVESLKYVETPDGRVLEEEIYMIDL